MVNGGPDPLDGCRPLERSLYPRSVYGTLEKQQSRQAARMTGVTSGSGEAGNGSSGRASRIATVSTGSPVRVSSSATSPPGAIAVRRIRAQHEYIVQLDERARGARPEYLARAAAELGERARHGGEVTARGVHPHQHVVGRFVDAGIPCKF